MAPAQPVTADASFQEAPPVARLVFERLRTLVEALDPCAVRITRSQVAFRRTRASRTRGSLGATSRTPRRPSWSRSVDHEIASPRFKEVVAWLTEAAALADG